VEIELLDVARLVKLHAVEHHDDTVAEREETSNELAHRPGCPRLAVADAVRRRKIGLHVAEVGSAGLREDVAGAPVALPAEIIGAGEQVIAEVVHQQRVASPRSKIERLRRAEITGRTLPLP